MVLCKLHIFDFFSFTNSSYKILTCATSQQRGFSKSYDFNHFSYFVTHQQVNSLLFPCKCASTLHKVSSRRQIQTLKAFENGFFSRHQILIIVHC